MTIQERLRALRQLMQQHHLDFYFVSNSDPHQNEYLPEAWQRYQYISGFTGSNAEVLIGLDKAYFWTDGRYTDQAKLELPSDLFEIFTYAQGGSSSLQSFIAEHFPHARIGTDPSTLTLQQAGTLPFVFVEKNLIDAIRPESLPLTHNKICVLAESYTGQSTPEKLKKLRAFLKHEKQEALIINELSSIAWLFNLRGTDIPHNPLFLSYALVTLQNCILFVHPGALSQKTQDYLADLKVEVRDYTHFYSTIASCCPTKVMLDKQTGNQAIFNALKSKQVTIALSPISLWKACKNEVEIKGSAMAHHIDAIAMIRFLSWLDHHKTGHTEISLAEKLLSFRQMSKSFQGTSFDTIAGYGPHGAIIHYHANSENSTAVGENALFLLDSGGQYLEGTTDITRTLHLGKPTDEEKHYYTLVLKGHLALKRACFPAGTRGEQLDVLARQFLWQEGVNYAHGTGHGVGAFLCVHEGPQRISTAATTTALQENMILSNEPGVYFSGKFGIRIENLCYVKKAPIENQGFGEFYTFEDLTLVPYARNLIAKDLLTPREVDQINAYHTHILEELGSSFEVETLKWLIEATQPI